MEIKELESDENMIAEEVSAAQEDEAPELDNSTVNPDEGEHSDGDPYGVKKRLGMQAKKHAREMRQLQERIMHLETNSHSDSANPHDSYSYNSNPYPSPGQPIPPGMNEEERIQHAVRLALGAKEHAERQAKDAERQAHVHKQYERLHSEFDKASDKYDDFDDVVRGDDIPFTPHVRDALLLVENPAEVAYKLGKNKSELERISKLHPLDQAREVNKLSFSLMGGNTGKQSTPSRANPIGSIRPNPAHSSNAITDKTPPSVIRARMKAGTFK